MSELAQMFAAELRRTFREKQITVTDAARQLGVTRQAMYNYLNGKSTPRDKRLALAMRIWNLSVTVGGTTFDRSDFAKPLGPAPVSQQLDLWKTLESIQQQDLRINVRRTGDEMHLVLQISIPA